LMRSKPFDTSVSRAVLDSSVLISAFLTPHGVSAKLLDAAEQAMFELCISREILSETRQSLKSKVKRIRRYYAYPDEKVDLFHAKYRRASQTNHAKSRTG
jgi:putative PIN family toxin of toxin-antitoxin system